MSQSSQVSDLRGSLPTPPQHLDDASSPSSIGSQESIFSHASSDSTSTQSSSNSEGQSCSQFQNHPSDTQTSDAIHCNITENQSYFPQPAVFAQPLPPAQRQHPRRSSSGPNETRRIPPLVRQDDRKVLFVNDLVGELDRN